MMSPKIQIVMAVYNGMPYLVEQLDSIFSQIYSNLELLIRTDACTDHTVLVATEYATRYPGRVRLLEGDVRLGARGNFSAALNEANADYVMFADADDVWLPTKVAQTFAKMRSMESSTDRRIPLMVHTDLRLVDCYLAMIDRSFWHYQNIHPAKGLSLSRQLVQNYVTGCTVMINRALLNMCRPVPQEAIMHDWWLALAAAAFGKIGFLSEQTILYRQHGRNDTGAKKWSAGFVLSRAQMVFDSKAMAARMLRTQQQAHAFLERFHSRLTPQQCALVNRYVHLGEMSPLLKRLALIRHGFYMDGALRNIGLFVGV